MSDLHLFCREALRKRRKLLTVYVTAGFPRREWTVPLAKAIFSAGADILELGMPFSDPLADGPTIQHAATVALRNGFRRDQIFDVSRVLAGENPVLIMGYYNNLLGGDSATFLRKCVDSSVSGLIVPDLPIDEEPELWQECSRQAPLIPFVSPTTPIERRREIDQINAPFAYAVSVAGVTGARDSLGENVAEYLRQVKSIMRTPVLVGFGISGPQIAAKVAGIAEGVIVGSAVIERIEQSKTLDEAIESVGSFIKELRNALDEVSTVKAVSC